MNRQYLPIAVPTNKHDTREHDIADSETTSHTTFRNGRHSAGATGQVAAAYIGDTTRDAVRTRTPVGRTTLVFPGPRRPSS